VVRRLDFLQHLLEYARVQIGLIIVSIIFAAYPIR
jgi:hypothetical protein